MWGGINDRKISFEAEAIDRIEVNAADARHKLANRVIEVFGDRGVAAFRITPVIPAASGFMDGEVEQQDDMAHSLNQALSRAPYPIPWRMAHTRG